MHPLAAAAALLHEADTHAELVDSLKRGRKRIQLRGSQGVSGPLALLLAARELKRPVWVVTPDLRRARRLAADLSAVSRVGLTETIDTHVLPQLEGDPYALIPPHAGVQRERAATFGALSEPVAEGEIRVLITPAKSLLVPVPPPGVAGTSSLVFEVGEELPPEEAAELLMRAGHVRADVVSTWGEFCSRGAVLDLFPPDAESPVRVEYWGDEITEIREFDPVTQRSTGQLRRVAVGAILEAEPDAAVALRFAERVRKGIRYDVIPPFIENILELLEDDASFPGFEILRWAVSEGVSPAEHLEAPIIACDAPDLVEDELRHGFEQLEEALPEDLVPFLPGPADVLRSVEAVIAEVHEGADVVLPDIAWSDQEGGVTVDLSCRPVRRHGGDLGGFLNELREHVDLDAPAGIVLESEGRLERMREVLQEVELGDRVVSADAPESDGLAGGSILLGLGTLDTGFRVGPFLLHAESDIFGEAAPARRERPRKALKSFSADLKDLKKGDAVVHADHGVGRFAGVTTVGEGESAREFMLLEYHEGDKLYVPLDRLDLVEKYSGSGGVLTAKLDRLGGSTWEKVKRTVKKAMVDMTRELLDLYATRRTAAGFKFSEDGNWQTEFEASFPYEETEDQLSSISEVKADMCSGSPMDRLVVGDVGFGKTEVALRAAFKAVMDGKQVAVLAPTTVLAFQHQATFARRCNAWPVKVELLSRFRTPKQVKATLERVKDGSCDIIIGTHRLLSKDVKFKDLGLLIVDEEQRFGVRHKERIKQLRKEVDVLTLTATPIPRTLSMAMGGLRDMSVIETPPQNRRAVQTYVLPFSPEVVSAAIRQELDRGGQVYFVHDRVQSIYSMANLVRKLVPGVKIGVAHGQMPERELEAAMVDFLHGELDVLVSTTVIENGLDIPRANTLMVNRADRHGLSQLYQLRGRVGRSDRQAHAYFFVPGKRQLSPDARRRLAALQEFTELGSGFRIAALDLEIRGAGNLLGGDQHGHIAAVGFDMYVRLLEETVQELQGLETAPSFRAQITVPLDLRLPAEYVSDEAQRLGIYRRFATVSDQDELLALSGEVRDRYGPSPSALERLGEHARLRLRAERLRIESLESDGRKVTLQFAKEPNVKHQSLIRLMGEREGSTFSPSGLLVVPAQEGLGPVEAAWDVLRELG